MKEKKEKKDVLELTRKGSEAANPFRMMRRFARDMERLLEDFEGFRLTALLSSELGSFRTKELDWVPKVEVLHNNGRFIVRVDLPGLSKDDVKVELSENMLTISGERKDEKEEKGEGFYRSERSYGNFYRQLPLPQGAITENAEATFVNGVLEVMMPAPRAESSTRELEVKNAPAAESQVKAAA